MAKSYEFDRGEFKPIINKDYAPNPQPKGGGVSSPPGGPGVGGGLPQQPAYPMPVGNSLSSPTSTYQQGLTETRTAAENTPQLSLFNERLNQLYNLPGFGGAGGVGGGGGGGGKMKPIERSEQFKNMQQGMYDMYNNMLSSESPFGASAVGRRTEHIDLAAQQQEGLLHEKLLNQGFQPGSPQYEKAMTDSRMGTARQRADVIQQMAEADSQYGLQKSQVLNEGFRTMQSEEELNRQHLMKVGQINRQNAAASAAAATANAKWAIMMKLNIAKTQFGAGQEVDKDQWSRYMMGAQFDQAKMQDARDFEYTKNYNTQMINLQRELANNAAKQKKSSGILGFLGKAVGAVGGFLLGGPAGAAAGAGLGGGLLGGGGSSPQSNSLFDTGLGSFNLSPYQTGG